MPTVQLHQQLCSSQEMTPIYWEKRNPPDMVSDPRLQAVMHHVRMAWAILVQSASSEGGISPVMLELVRSYLDDARRDAQN
jgi:hypothetical protein